MGKFKATTWYPVFWTTNKFAPTSFGFPSGVVVTINGLTDGNAVVGTEGSITVSVSSGTITSTKWGNSFDGIELGTGANPTTMTDGDTLFVTVTVDGSDYYSSAPVVVTAPVASNGLPDRNYLQNVAITTLDVSTDFTGPNITYTLAPSSSSLPTGLFLASNGQITGTPTTVSGAVNIVVRGTNTGGFDDTGFQIEISEGDTENPSIESLTLGTQQSDGTLPISVVGLDEDCDALFSWTSSDQNSATPEQVETAGDGGTALTDQVDAGNFAATTGDGEYTDSMPTTLNGSYYLQMVFRDNASNLSTVYSDGPVTVRTTAPDAFVGSDWSVSTGSGANELDITITTVPDAGAVPITDIQYDVDGNNTWTSLGTTTTGTATITMADPSTSYDIRLRAVSLFGNASAGNTESATSGAGAAAFFTASGTGPYFVDPNNIPNPTEAIRYRIKWYVPSSAAGTTFTLARVESQGFDVEVFGTSELNLEKMEDSSQTNLVGNNNDLSGPLAYDVWHTLDLKGDFKNGATGQLTGTVDGGAITPLVFAGGNTGRFSNVREVSFGGTSTGLQLAPAGVQIEYYEVYYTRSDFDGGNGLGVEYLHKRIAGNAATVNADGWKNGDDAT